MAEVTYETPEGSEITLTWPDGREETATLVEWDNYTAIVKLADGTIKAWML